jgi:hypothetical protein
MAEQDQILDQDPTEENIRVSTEKPATPLQKNAALSDALNSSMTSPLDINKFKSSGQVLQAKANLIPLKAEQAGKLEQAKANLSNELLENKAKASEQLYTNTKRKIDETHDKESMYPAPEFHPTEENISSLGSLFSLVSTMGIALGHQGKLSSMGAMNAMSGMLKGWKEGRKDLYERELKNFNKEVERIKSIKEEIRRDLDDYMKLAPYDKEAALDKLNAVVSKAGTSSVIGEQIKNMKINDTYELLGSIDKMLEKKEDLAIKAIEKRDAANNRTDAAIIKQIKKDYPNIDLQNFGYIAPKQQEKVIDSFGSIKEIEHISDFIAHHKDAVGALAKAMTSLNANAFDSLDAYEAQIARIPMSEDAQVLNKLLTTQAFNDAQATGARPTVYLDRVFKGLYAQSLTAPALLDVLKERQQYANDIILAPYDLNLENMSNEGRNAYKFFNSKNSRDYLKQYGPPLIATKADIEATLKANKNLSRQDVIKKLTEAGFQIEQ